MEFSGGERPRADVDTSSATLRKSGKFFGLQFLHPWNGKNALLIVIERIKYERTQDIGPL